MPIDLKECIILDNGSTIDLFGNKKLVSDIRKSNHTLKMATNAGCKENKLKGNVPGYGEVWYDKRAIANVFSSNNMAQRHRITYDSGKEDAFIVHKDGKQIKFEASKNGLYYFKPNYKLKNKTQDGNSNCKQNDSIYQYGGYDHNNIETVKENPIHLLLLQTMV